MAAGQVVLIAAERRLLAWLQQRGIMPRLFVRRAATLVRRPASHVPSCVVGFHLCSSGASPGQLVRQAAALVLWLLCLPLHAQSPIYPLLVGAVCRVAQRAPAGCPHWRLKQHRLIKRWLRSR